MGSEMKPKDDKSPMPNGGEDSEARLHADLRQPLDRSKLSHFHCLHNEETVVNLVLYHTYYIS